MRLCRHFQNGVVTLFTCLTRVDDDGTWLIHCQNENKRFAMWLHFACTFYSLTWPTEKGNWKSYPNLESLLNKGINDLATKTLSNVRLYQLRSHTANWTHLVHKRTKWRLFITLAIESLCNVWASRTNHFPVSCHLALQSKYLFIMTSVKEAFIQRVKTRQSTYGTQCECDI